MLGRLISFVVILSGIYASTLMAEDKTIRANNCEIFVDKVLHYRENAKLEMHSFIPYVKINTALLDGKVVDVSVSYDSVNKIIASEYDPFLVGKIQKNSVVSVMKAFFSDNYFFKEFLVRQEGYAWGMYGADETNYIMNFQVKTDKGTVYYTPTIMMDYETLGKIPVSGDYNNQAFYAQSTNQFMSDYFNPMRCY